MVVFGLYQRRHFQVLLLVEIETVVGSVVAIFSELVRGFDKMAVGWRLFRTFAATQVRLKVAVQARVERRQEVAVTTVVVNGVRQP